MHSHSVTHDAAAAWGVALRPDKTAIELAQLFACCCPWAAATDRLCLLASSSATCCMSGAPHLSSSGGASEQAVSATREDMAHILHMISTRAGILLQRQHSSTQSAQTHPGLGEQLIRRGVRPLLHAPALLLHTAPVLHAPAPAAYSHCAACTRPATTYSPCAARKCPAAAYSHCVACTRLLLSLSVSA